MEMKNIPFLRPSMVEGSSLAPFLKRIDQSGIYSNFGPVNTEFEARLLVDYFDGQGAITTVCNGTLALMLAIREVMRPKGKYALMPSFTFAATVQAALWCGLTPYFVDIDPDEWSMDETITAQLVESLGDEVAVVIPYATFGTAISLERWNELHTNGVPVVVDAAPCFGGVDSSGHFGKDFSGAVMFSLHATKPFGIGEGGLIYSADEKLIASMRKASNFGFSSDRTADCVGLNAKLSEYAAALGMATLEGFQTKIAKLTTLNTHYVETIEAEGLADLGWKNQKMRGSPVHQFFALLAPTAQERTNAVKRLAKAGIEARSYFDPPCHEHPAFTSFQKTDMSLTENISARVLNLPLWAGLESSDVDFIVDALT